MAKYLFITWDGPQVSYLEGLFLPIFKGLQERGHSFHVLQFTWASNERVAAIEALCRAADIPYRSVKIIRRFGPIGPLTTAVWGAKHIKSAVHDWNIDTLMPRSLMPALATLSMRDRKGLRIIFDADGLAVDERVDFAGLSKKSLIYRMLRAIEARTAKLADRVLVRTPRAIDILVERARTNRAKFYVVGNGRDPKPYLTGWPNRNDAEFRLCYAGSIGFQYCPSQMIEVALRLRAELPNLVFRIFTGNVEALEAVLDQAGISDRDWIKASRLNPSDMPAALMECDLALALRKPEFSTQGVSPIKIGEYLLAGLPLIGTEGIGPVEPAIHAGVMHPIEQDSSHVWPWVRDEVLPQKTAIQKRSQEIGLKYFSLQSTVDSYDIALSTLPEWPDPLHGENHDMAGKATSNAR
jgi:glycosyltransferase involved in cell wall biosynthesis